MPVAGKEYIPQRVFYTYFEGVISVDELFEIDQQIVTFLDQTTAPLGHLFIDVRLMTKPQGLQNLSKMQTGRHPKLGWGILVGNSNPVTKFLLSTVGSLFKMRLRYVDTFGEAIQFLQYVDTTLPDLNTLECRQRISEYMPLDVQP